MPKKVFIIQEGNWGFMRQEEGDYDSFVNTLKRVLGEAERPVSDPRGEDRGKEKICDVEVISSFKEAVERACSLPMNNGPATLVFITRGMLATARKVKKEHPRLRVVLFTGLYPEDEVIVASKVVLNSETLADVVFRW